MDSSVITNKSQLFSTTTLGGLTLQNHLVMAPMTRSRAINNVPNELIAHYYAQRASAGLASALGAGLDICMRIGCSTWAAMSRPLAAVKAPAWVEVPINMVG